MSDTKEADIEVDSRGATCPGPLMDLIGTVKETDSETLIELRTSDAGSKNDVPEWLEEAGHELVDIVEEDDHWNIYVRTT